MGLFATFPSNASCGYGRFLICFSPFENEDCMTADAHVGYIKYVLGLLKRYLLNVVCFIGDNCSSNMCITEKIPGKVLFLNTPGCD